MCNYRAEMTDVECRAFRPLRALAVSRNATRFCAACKSQDSPKQKSRGCQIASAPAFYLPDSPLRQCGRKCVIPHGIAPATPAPKMTVLSVGRFVGSGV